MDFSLFRRGIKIPPQMPPKPIQEIPPPSELIYPYRQSANVSMVPIVKSGAKVNVGQPIIASDKDRAVYVHATVSGTVKEIPDFVADDGIESGALVIESDNNYTLYEPPKDPNSLKALLEEAGIFLPKCGQLPHCHSIQTITTSDKSHIVIRLCNSDPHVHTLTGATDQLEEHMDDFKKGIQALTESSNVSPKVCFVASANQSVKTLESLGFPIIRVNPNRYPDASDGLLLKTATGIDPTFTLDGIQSSAWLVDITTVLDVGRSTTAALPFAQKYLTVIWPEGVTLCKVSIGTPVRHILRTLSIEGDFKKVIFGGPLEGFGIHSLDYPITRGVDAITLLSESTCPEFENRECINCGICARVCPSKLVPGMLSKYAQYEHWDKALTANIEHCIECGCCAYVCPSGRAMVQFIRLGKHQAKAKFNDQ